MDDSSHRSDNVTPRITPATPVPTCLPVRHVTPDASFDRPYSGEVAFSNNSAPTRPQSSQEAQLHRIVSVPIPWRGNCYRTSASDGDEPEVPKGQDFVRPHQSHSNASMSTLRAPQLPTSPEASQPWRRLIWRQRDSSNVSAVSRGPESFEGYGRGGPQHSEQTHFGLQHSRYASPVNAGNHASSQLMTYQPIRILQSDGPHMREPTASAKPATYEPKHEGIVPLTAEPKPEARSWNPTPNPGAKEYCTYYLRNGQCDYMQRTCQYKHFFPSTWDEMERVGFLCLPDWLAQIKPKLYKEVSDRLGPCPWGSFSGSRASKSRADVAREHLAAYGKNNQHASEREMVRGRKPIPLQRPEKAPADRRNRYAPARGPPGRQLRHTRGPKPPRMLDNNISQPASPSRSLPPVLERLQSSPSDADDDTDAKSVASCSDLIDFNSRHGSVSRFSSAVRKQNGRCSRRGSKLRNELSEAEPAVEHPVLFQNAGVPRNKAQVDLVEARDAEHRRNLQAGASHTNCSDPVVATKQKKASLSCHDRIQQQVMANSKANSKSHPAGNTTRSASSGKVTRSKASTAMPSPSKNAYFRKQNRSGKKTRGNKRDHSTATDPKYARIKELESMVVTPDPRDARIRELEAMVAATSLLGSSKTPSTVSPSMTRSGTSAAAAPTTSPRRTRKGNGKGRAHVAPAHSPALPAPTVGTISPGRAGNDRGKGRAHDVLAPHVSAQSAIAAAHDVSVQSGPFQSIAKTCENSGSIMQILQGPAVEANVISSAAVAGVPSISTDPAHDVPAQPATSHTTNKTGKIRGRSKEVPEGSAAEVSAIFCAAVPSVPSISTGQAEK